jgi:hypothetical protein
MADGDENNEGLEKTQKDSDEVNNDKKIKVIIFFQLLPILCYFWIHAAFSSCVVFQKEKKRSRKSSSRERTRRSSSRDKHYRRRSSSRDKERRQRRRSPTPEKTKKPTENNNGAPKEITLTEVMRLNPLASLQDCIAKLAVMKQQAAMQAATGNQATPMPGMQPPLLPGMVPGMPGMLPGMVFQAPVEL